MGSATTDYLWFFRRAWMLDYSSSDDCLFCKPCPRESKQGSIRYRCRIPVSATRKDKTLDIQQQQKLTGSHSYLYIWIFASCLDTAIVVYIPELFPNHLRAKGMSLGIASLALTDLVSSSRCILSEAVLT
jgi:hypothetical protein